MANTFHDQLSGSDLHVNKEYPATGTPLQDWTQTDARYTQQARTVATTGPLTGGGNLSADRTIALPAATASQSGYLSAADWSAFDAKGFKSTVVVGPSGSSGNDYTADGTTDDVALRNACQSGRTVFVRSGTYNLTSPINLANKTNLHIVAEGQSVVFQIPQASLGSFGSLYMFYGNTTQDIIFDGITFNGNYANYVSPISGKGGSIAPGTDWTIRRCAFIGSNYFPVWLGTGCFDTKILYNRFEGPSRGLDNIGGGGATNVEIAHNTWEASCNGNAWDNTTGTNFHIHHNTIKTNNNFIAECMQHVRLDHNRFTGTGGISITSDAGYNFASIRNSRYIFAHHNEFNGGAITCSMETSPTRTSTVGGDIEISNNYIDTPSTYGILVRCGGDGVAAWGSNYLIVNNRVRNANDSNTVTFNHGQGIIHPSAINISQGTGVLVAGNVCIDDRATPQQQYGIEVGQTYNPSSSTEPNSVTVADNHIVGVVLGKTNRVSATYTTDYSELTPNNGTLDISANIALKNANSKVTGTTGLTLEETGDTYGTMRLSLQNRSNVNGVILEQAGSFDLVDIVAKGLSNQRNIRYENRGGGYVGTPEFQLGSPADPSLVISDVGTLVRKGYFKVNGSIATALVTKTAAYTLTATDSIILADATAAAFTMTLPTAIGCQGRQYTIKRVNSGSNNATVGCAGGQFIDGASTKTLGAQFSWLTVISDNAGWQIVGQGGTVS